MAGSAAGSVSLVNQAPNPVAPDLGQIWCLSRRDAPPRHDWGDCVAVYNPVSGDTHLLDPVSGELLGAMAKNPQSAAALCQHVAHYLDIPNDASVATSVAQLLQHLDELGLIEPAAS